MNARPLPIAFRQRGVTLVELIISLVVIAVAVAGVLDVMSATTMRSADPMVREQAQLIGEAYMEEILLKAFSETSSNKVCPAVPASRNLYTYVCDYRGLPDNVVRDQFGTAILALSDYTVSVTISPSPSNPADATVYLKAASPDATGVWNDYGNNRIRILRVDVTVTGPGGVSTTLTGYRTDYDCVIGTGANCPTLT